MLWYYGALTLQFTLPLAVVVGAGLAAGCFAATKPNRPPEWSMGFPFPVGAAVVAVVGFVASAMWIDTIAGAQSPTAIIPPPFQGSSHAPNAPTFPYEKG